jgi:hypothetical protein
LVASAPHQPRSNSPWPTYILLLRVHDFVFVFFCFISFQSFNLKIEFRKGVRGRKAAEQPLVPIKICQVDEKHPDGR